MCDLFLAEESASSSLRPTVPAKLPWGDMTKDLGWGW